MTVRYILLFIHCFKSRSSDDRPEKQLLGIVNLRLTRNKHAVMMMMMMTGYKVKPISLYCVFFNKRKGICDQKGNEKSFLENAYCQNQMKWVGYQKREEKGGTMRTKTKANRVIDIALSEEKAYFPGETIAGSILVHPKSQVKVKPITVKFIGEINLSFKEKETIQLFQLQKVIQINEGKSKILEAKLYSYPFKFTVPDTLPSALEVRTIIELSAVLDRPMMPETLCPKVEYPLTILELIDVTEPPYSSHQEVFKDGVTYSHGTCSIRLSTQRRGYTRGETIPVNLVVNTPKDFVKKDALQVDLIRKIKLNTARNTLETEELLKSNKFDLNIIGPYNFSQSITSHFLLRATPPTAHYKSLSVRYMIKARLLADKKTAICTVEAPITVGTWPRADIPIDDDEDEDIINQIGEIMISDDEEEQQQEKRHDSVASRANRNSIKSTHSLNNNNYTSNNNNNNNNNTTFTTSNSNTNITPAITTTINVERTNSIESHTSNGSRSSVHSWRSSTSSDPRHSMMQDHHQKNRNTLPVNPYPNGYLNRSTSTPDLQAPPTHLQNRSTTYYPQSSTHVQQQQYYYSSAPSQQQQQQQQQTYLGHRSSNSLQGISVYPNESLPPPSYVQQHRRLGSYDQRHSTMNTNLPTPPLDPAVPNHTLTFQPSPSQQHTGLNTPPVDSVNATKGIIYDSDDDDSDDSDDDLLAIIERKKKREARELRKRQVLYSVVE
ncbi:hypothetical protein K501DRAFT_330186 [Backusella circina FSU 941]|nr:hypothetical protein K501DRAFT_330186 [Backusella circina FSU 941]